jgi:hypothetical protein
MSEVLFSSIPGCWWTPGCYIDFTQFRCGTSPIPKTVVGVHTKHEFLPLESFFIFCNEHAQSTTLGPKLMFGVVSRNFVAARHPFRKRVSGCIQSTSFCHRNHFFVFHNEHVKSTTLGPKLMFGVWKSPRGGVNRGNLKFINLSTTTSQVSVRNMNESEREGGKQITGK